MTKKPVGKDVLTEAGLGEPEDGTSGGKGSDAKGAETKEEALQRWLEQARAGGMQPKELVWNLHVAQGSPLLDCSRLLKISLAETTAFYTQRRREMMELAPQSAEEFTAMREEVRERLQATYEQACGTPDVRYLGTRLKALDQLAKLHGLYLGEAPEAPPAEREPPVPVEIQPEVENLGLEKIGWLEKVEEVRALRGF